MNRRIFLGAAAGVLVDTSAQAAAIPIVDTHIHLYDPTRPGGVPWPAKGGKVPYKPTYPRTFRKTTRGLGVRAAIEVECSPLLEDNQWVLDVMAKDTIMVGMVGNLDLAAPDFGKHLDRFHKNPLYLGIRYGYLWGRTLGDPLQKPAFIAGLRALADSGLELDTVGPAPLLDEVVRITDKVPNLRIVIDHLASQDPPKDHTARLAYDTALRELGKRSQVYVKVSAVLRRPPGNPDAPVPHDLASYKDKLDLLWETFGEDRVIYGSDWTNSESVGTYAQVLDVVREYFFAKGHAVAEKFFWKNSLAAYRWKKRASNQPGL